MLLIASDCAPATDREVRGDRDSPAHRPDAAGCACADGAVYPFFIGEAAYYESGKDVAFMLARKETLKVCGVCIVKPPTS